jgi:adenylate cyclase
MRWRIALWFFLSLLTLLFVQTQPTLWRQTAQLAQDVLIQKLASDAPVTSLALIDIDEASLEMMGAWPWSRSLMASLLDKAATDYHAGIIGLDIVFPEASNSTDDHQLVQAVKETQAIIAIVWDYQGQTPPLQVGDAGQAISAQTSPDLPQAYGYLGNFSDLAAIGTQGHISPSPDSNGKIRYIAPLVNWQNQAYPMLALSLLAKAQNKTLHPVMRHNCIYPFAGQSLSLCLDDEGQWSIPYRYQLSSFIVVPAWQIMLQQAPRDILKQRQVIIGSSALGLSDRVVTPLATITPGMMVHAQILASLQAGGNQSRLAGPNLWLFLLVSLTFLSYLLVRWDIRAGLLLVVLASMLWLWWVSVDYLQGYVLPDIALPIVVMVFWLVSQSALEWSLIKLQSQRIYRLFQDYLPPHLLKQALTQPDERMLLPQQRRVTVLFADIAGFTTMTEQMPTAEAAALTRHILSLLTQAVYAQDGTLDKYMGDALMAFWNAPLDQHDHAQRAAQAALLMREKLYELNHNRALLGLAPIHVRIGINSGDVLVGDLGTQWRHAYTVLGDAVNVAQRLMVAAGQLGVDIAIGEAAIEGVQRVESIGDMYLPGRERMERVFVIPVTINP